MRTLEFIVEGDNLKQNPACNFNGLFPGKNNKIVAKFTFSKDWESDVKVAAFWSVMDQEYPPSVLNDEDSCVIPLEALARPSFRVQIFGKNRGKVKSTNKLTVYQRGGIL